MSQMGYIGIASSKARAAQIEELLMDEKMPRDQRKALIEEKTKLYDRLYPPEAEGE